MEGYIFTSVCLSAGLLKVIFKGHNYMADSMKSVHSSGGSLGTDLHHPSPSS